MFGFDQPSMTVNAQTRVQIEMPNIE
jgi:hypothetical protein